MNVTDGPVAIVCVQDHWHVKAVVNFLFVSQRFRFRKSWGNAGTCEMESHLSH